MHLPLLDPNFVLWCNVVSDVVTTLASIGACTAATMHYLKYLRDKAKALRERLNGDRQ